MPRKITIIYTENIYMHSVCSYLNADSPLKKSVTIKDYLVPGCWIKIYYLLLFRFG